MSRVSELILYWGGLIYLSAFLSLFHQLPGLYGPNGVLPVDALKIEKPSGNLLRAFLAKPNLMIFLNMTNYEGLELFCLLGAILSFMVCFFEPKTKLRVFTYGILYLLYLSCLDMGQTFLHFQWDIMLLEFGVICLVLVLAPRQGVVLSRWLLVRLMFHSGYKKLESGCPTWWGLTALNYHFESQCIPTPLAYYAHHLPDAVLEAGVAVTFVAQIGLVFFALSPNRRLRILCGWTHILHQLGIAASGNYNFFNWLTIVICLACFDDQHLDFILPSKVNSVKVKKPSEAKWLSFGAKLMELLQLGFMGYLISKAIWVDYEQGRVLLLETAEDQSKLFWVRNHFVKPAILASVIWVSFASIKDFMSSMSSALAIPLSFCILTCSFVPFTDMDRNTQQSLPRKVHQLYHSTRQFQAVHSYGLFRRMTGVGGRPEVVIEMAGTDGIFKEIEFYYKPTNLTGNLPWVAPHQPRLDWQMWFAALGSINHNPWLVNFSVRLLQESSVAVQLIDQADFEAKFKDGRPIYLRMHLYDYHYTENRSNGVWRRDNKREYLDSITLKDPRIINFIKQSGLKLKKEEKTFLQKYFAKLRSYVDKFSAETIIQTTLLVLLSKKVL